MKRALLILLCISMTLGLIACGSKKDAVNKSKEYPISVIVYAFDADSEVSGGIETLYDEMKAHSTDVKLKNDKIEKGSEGFEILVGITNRSESIDAVKNLKVNDYYIGMSGEAFVIGGQNSASTLAAIDYFIENYDTFVKDKKILSDKSYTFRDEYDIASFKIADKEVSEFSIVYPETYSITAEKHIAQTLQAKLSSESGYCPALKDNTEKAQGAEIVIGDARSTAAELGEFDYDIKVENGNLYINAGGVFAYSKAVSVLFDQIKNDSVSIPANYKSSAKDTFAEDTEKDFVYVSYLEDKILADTPPVKSISLLGTDITEYTIVHHDFGERYSGWGMNEIYAAQQLQKYIEYATGIELPLVTDSQEPAAHEIIVGTTNREDSTITAIDRSKYGEEGVLIKAENGNLILTGGSKRGCTYAAYTFLEEYIGCRFFTEDCEVIYKADKIDIPADIHMDHTATMEYRDIYGYAATISEYASKRKVNGFHTRALNYAQGGTFDFAAGGIAYSHTMGNIYRLASQDSQPCFTDEEIYQKLLADVLKKLSYDPDAPVISVTQNDNFNDCKCASCSDINIKEGSNSGALIRFINRLAEDVEKEYPNVKILTLAYMFSFEAPKVTKPRHNVIIQYCPIDSCCAHALNDPACSRNKEYNEWMQGWADVTDNLYLWYYTREVLQDGVLPFMNFDALYENYAYFHQTGVKGIFNESCVGSHGGEFDTMRIYLMSRLMWEEDMTKEEYYTALYEFIDAYYGEASEVVTEYFNLLKSYAYGKHFIQYSSPQALLDTYKFNALKGETDSWWTMLNSFTYALPETQTRVKALQKGYKAISK